MNEGAFEYFIVISAFAVKRNSRILACSPAILDHVANQIIPHCKSHASVLMLMPWTSKTLITDRGPPTFGEGIFPKQVISSVAHMNLWGLVWGLVWVLVCGSNFGAVKICFNTSLEHTPEPLTSNEGKNMIKNIVGELGDYGSGVCDNYVSLSIWKLVADGPDIPRIGLRLWGRNVGPQVQPNGARSPRKEVARPMRQVVRAWSPWSCCWVWGAESNWKACFFGVSC